MVLIGLFLQYNINMNRGFAICFYVDEEFKKKEKLSLIIVYNMYLVCFEGKKRHDDITVIWIASLSQS